VQKLLADGTLDASGATAEIAPSLFPLDPLSASPRDLASRPARPARRAPRPAPAPEPPPAPKALSEVGRAKLEAAAQDLLSARQMLDALLHRSRKG
jgi:hypothetical protein